MVNYQTDYWGINENRHCKMKSSGESRRPCYRSHLVNQYSYGNSYNVGPLENHRTTIGKLRFHGISWYLCIVVMGKFDHDLNQRPHNG